jgi:hypothetical protein
MTDAEFEVHLPKFERSIYAISRKIAGSNEVLYDDLVQVGRISLWKFDLARVQTNVVGCINRHLRNRMIDFVRSESSKAKMVSLDDSHHHGLNSLFIDDAGIAVEPRLTSHDPETVLDIDTWN